MPSNAAHVSGSSNHNSGVHNNTSNHYNNNSTNNVLDDNDHTEYFDAGTVEAATCCGCCSIC